MVVSVGASDLLSVFGPAAEIGTLWLDELRRRTDAPSLAWSDATAITNRLLEELVARRAGRPTADLTKLLEEVPPPDVDDVVALRSVLRGRVASRVSLEAAMPLLQLADELIDDLLTAIVRAKVDALESAAFIDPLTGTGNRRGLERDLARELARSFRHGRPVSIAAIDVDGLKYVNDTRGHAAGDEVLRRLAHTLTAALRIGDGIYRVGGDEFVVLLPETGAEDVRVLLERAGAKAPSFSFGVACAPGDATSSDALLAHADAQLIDGRRRRRAGAAELIDLTDEGPYAAEPERERERERDQPRPAPEPEPAQAPGGAAGDRLVIAELVTGVGDRAFSAEVTLRAGGVTIVGRASGSSAGSAAKRIVAEAVLDASAKVDPGLASSFVEGVSILRVAEVDVAVVSLVVVGDVEFRAIGAAEVRERGPFDAVARASMDALNRRLAMAPRAFASRTAS